MNILLVNTNTVVSRLFILCTRDDSIKLKEVTNVNDVNISNYHMIFVDEASYAENEEQLREVYEDTQKIFLASQYESMNNFDTIIKKPFLPSQIIELIAKTEVNTVGEENNQNSDVSPVFPLVAEDKLNGIEMVKDRTENPAVLDMNEIEKIKTLLEMNESLEVTDMKLSDDELEKRKIEIIKEQLISDGLEIVDENDIMIDLNKESSLTKRENKKPKNKKLKFTNKAMKCIEDAVEVAMANMTRKQMKKLLKGKEIEVKIQLRGKH